jgi:hypothetical protein
MSDSGFAFGFVAGIGGRPSERVGIPLRVGASQQHGKRYQFNVSMGLPITRESPLPRDVAIVNVGGKQSHMNTINMPVFMQGLMQYKGN